MPKPPKATPHSDIDGVHQDEVPNVDRAAQLGDSAEELAGAQDESVARPEHSDDRGKRDRTK